MRLPLEEKRRDTQNASAHGLKMNAARRTHKKLTWKMNGKIKNRSNKRNGSVQNKNDPLQGKIYLRKNTNARRRNGAQTYMEIQLSLIHI